MLFSISFASDVEVRVNYGKFNLPTDPIIVNNRTMVPLRAISEIFGAEIEWDPKGIVTIIYNNNKIILPINSNRVVVNNDIFRIDSPAIIKDSLTMVPLKFLSEYLGIDVAWHEDERIVNITIEDDNLLARAETVSRSYAPRNLYPNASGKIVVIDAGHGGSEPGAYYGGVSEKNINLAIAKQVEQYLKKYNVRVYMTRTSDTTTSLASRSNLANALNADLFISIHSNAIEGKAAVKGSEILYKNSSLIKKGVSNSILAQNLLRNITETAGTYGRGLINRTGLYVLNHTNVPAALVEVGYMTNSSELANLVNPSFQENAGKGIAIGILQSLQIMK
jgi:N-acetylmuramoyl-L-alanine amidase